jgi:hypothetical protein
MWYFAYGHDMNWRSIAEWADQNSLRPPVLRSQGKPAVLSNHRLAFPRYDEQWGGGVADIIDEPGKSVFGALVHISVPVFKLLEALYDRRVDEKGREIGASKLIDVSVAPYSGGDRIAAVAMKYNGIERGTVPPSRHYIARMVESALELDLSALWVMQLRSFGSWNESEIELDSKLEPATRLLKQARHRDVAPIIPIRTTTDRMVV